MTNSCRAVESRYCKKFDRVMYRNNDYHGLVLMIVKKTHTNDSIETSSVILIQGL